MTFPLKYATHRWKQNRSTNSRGQRWQYEPKWDGFRCLAFKDGDKLELRSKSGKSLSRYFPELIESLATLKARTFSTGKLRSPTGIRCRSTRCCNGFILRRAAYCIWRK